MENLETVETVEIKEEDLQKKETVIAGQKKKRGPYTKKNKESNLPLPQEAQDAAGKMLGAVYCQLYSNFFPSQPLGDDTKKTVEECWAVISKRMPVDEFQIAIGTLAAIPLSAIANNYAQGKGIIG